MRQLLLLSTLVAVASANRIGCYRGNQGPNYNNHLNMEKLEWMGQWGNAPQNELLTPQK